jgi:hypothetical protein
MGGRGALHPAQVRQVADVPVLIDDVLGDGNAIGVDPGHAPIIPIFGIVTNG